MKCDFAWFDLLVATASIGILAAQIRSASPDGWFSVFHESPPGYD
jgi:hypothetical protein